MALPSHPYSQRITKPNRRKWLSRKAKRICGRSDREGRGGGNVPTGAISDPPSLIPRSEEHTSELQSLMRISYDDLCLKKTQNHNTPLNIVQRIFNQQTDPHTHD